MNSNWKDYAARLTTGESQEETALHTGIGQSTISRWLRGAGTPSDAAVIANFAKTYGRNPLEAFVAAGVIDLDAVAPALDADAWNLLADLGLADAPAPGQGKGRTA